MPPQNFKFEEAFEEIRYPSGEFHLKLRSVPRIHEGDVIVANIVDFNGIARCVVGDRLLQRNGVDVDWVIPFFPFAREDRRNNTYDGMELKLALELIMELGAVTVDPHSDVTSFGIRFFPQSEVVLQYILETDLFEDNPVVAIPDAGAAKKVSSWLYKYHALYGQSNAFDSVQCLKKRDPLTGKLSGFTVVDPKKVYGRNVVIVDDICDGGGTFIGLADELFKGGAQQLRLAVTHGLFTKGLEEITSRFARLYTLDTCKIQAPELTKISLFNLIERGNVI